MSKFVLKRFFYIVRDSSVLDRRKITLNANNLEIKYLYRKKVVIFKFYGLFFIEKNKLN